MTATSSPPEPDEPSGPAERHARRYGKQMPLTPETTPTGPKAWHEHLFPNRKAN
ncbi:hypothetical protein [Dietzia sp. PP-33]|jgi:hypothetical protein|uniref:hypothetical protein n=1 Tax=Dietzia sp. PP-33 TaxID=2957500 RepID=UPI0029B91765|nr:hypothetical protein [Dietzia sp. PP-33]MDX2358568.1 hypothetical protein [Dietzia sp. PP-33]